MSIEIANPQVGGASHTSRNRADYLCATGQAVITDDGRLRLIHIRDTQRDCIRPEGAAYWWNGSPKDRLLRKVNIRRIYDPDCGPVIPMHRPGEVRS